MLQPTVELTPKPPRTIQNPTGFALQGWQRGSLLVLLMGILYVRLWRKKRAKNRICSHCGTINPPHQNNCRKCSAPLLGA